MIPQNGYEIMADLSLERNQFDPSFEVSEDYGTLSLVFSNHDTYRFNASLKNNISIIKSRRIALNQKFDLGYVSILIRESGEVGLIIKSMQLSLTERPLTSAEYHSSPSSHIQPGPYTRESVIVSSR